MTEIIPFFILFFCQKQKAKHHTTLYTEFTSHNRSRTMQSGTISIPIDAPDYIMDNTEESLQKKKK